VSTAPGAASVNCVAPVPVAIRAFLYTFRLLCRDASDLASREMTCSDRWAMRAKIQKRFADEEVGLPPRALTAVPWLLGGIGLIVISVVGYRLSANVRAAVCAYLIVGAMLVADGSKITKRCASPRMVGASIFRCLFRRYSTFPGK